ncbi:hypothetical protein BV25DRAFT_1769720, partial [Artomyces pyxidatus]
HDFPITPTPDTLSFYCVYMCHHIQPRSVASYLSGICNQLQHLFPNIREVRKSSIVAGTLAGCIKLLSEPTHRKQPLSLDDIASLIAFYPRPSHDDCLFLAIALCGFFALHRLGELTDSDDLDLRNSRKRIRRSSVAVGPSFFEYELRTHKADRQYEGNLVIIAHRAEGPDPHQVFTQYLSSRDSRFPYLPALWVRESGQVPTRTWFINRLRRHFNNNYAGHSLRSGGATHFASEGWPDDRIQ